MILKKHNFDLPLIEKTYGAKYFFSGYEPYFSVEAGNREIRKNRDIVVSQQSCENNQDNAMTRLLCMYWTAVAMS
jgi:hypothetical protein